MREGHVAAGRPRFRFKRGFRENEQISQTEESGPEPGAGGPAQGHTLEVHTGSADSPAPRGCPSPSPGVNTASFLQHGLCTSWFLPTLGFWQLLEPWHRVGSAQLGPWPRLNLPLSPSCWVCTHDTESEGCNILSPGFETRHPLPRARP